MFVSHTRQMQAVLGSTVCDTPVAVAQCRKCRSSRTKVSYLTKRVFALAKLCLT